MIWFHGQWEGFKQVAGITPCKVLLLSGSIVFWDVVLSRHSLPLSPRLIAVIPSSV